MITIEQQCNKYKMQFKEHNSSFTIYAWSQSEVCVALHHYWRGHREYRDDCPICRSLKLNLRLHGGQIRKGGSSNMSKKHVRHYWK